MIDTPAEAPPEPLVEYWQRWAILVRSFALKPTLRPPLDDDSYERIHQNLVQACRVASVSADDQTRASAFNAVGGTRLRV